MSQPREGGDGDQRSTLKLAPTHIAMFTRTWTNGEYLVTVELGTGTAFYHVQFSKRKFLEFVVEAMKLIADMLRDEQRGR